MVTQTSATSAAAGFGCPRDLRDYLHVLEQAGELRRVRTEVDWRLEAGAISRLVCERREAAPLFENVKDYPDQQLAAVLFGPSKPMVHGRTALALGLSKNTPTLELIEIVRQRLRAPRPPTLVNRDQAKCKDVVLTGEEIDLNRFAFPWIKEIDGGRYVGTHVIVVTKDLDTGWVNWGTYRCMLKDAKHFAILLNAASHQHGGRMFNRYEAADRPMPVALVIGGDAVSHLAATIPADYGVSEVDLAGGLRGEGVRLVKCETLDLEVPANAEMVIEAEVLPGDRVDEGPFGEFTGHASHRGKTPVARVTCISHRNGPILTMANPSKPWDDDTTPYFVTYSAVARNRLEDQGLPVKAVYYYVPTVVVISVKPRPGLHKRILATLMGGEPLALHGVVFVDEDVDVTNLEDVWWAICSRMNPEHYEVLHRVPGLLLLPWLTPEQRERRETTCFVMDATFPYYWPADYREAHTKVCDFLGGWSPEVQQRVLQRWKEYGYAADKAGKLG